MAATKSVPRGWERQSELQYYDSFLEREYTRIAYSDGERTVYISDVQEPNKFGGWGFLVRVQGGENRQLGLVEDLQDAREIAHEYMGV